MVASAETLIAERYARAIFEFSLELEDVKGLQKANNALVDILNALDEHTKERFLNRSTRKEAAEIVALLTTKMPSFFSNFLKVVARKGRISMLETILEAINTKANKAMKKLHITVKSARHLSEKNKSAILAALNNHMNVRLGKDLDISISCEVEEDLLAGAVLAFGARRIDTSLASDLSMLSQYLKRQTFPA